MKKSIMWEYIKQEKDILLKLIESKSIEKECENLYGLKKMYIIAHGSSYNAANAIAPFIMKYAHIDVQVYTPSNFKFNMSLLENEDKNSTILCAISQTGTSRGVIEVIQMIKPLGFKAITITSVPESPIAKLGEYCLNLSCGEENSNAKTKGYSCSLVVLMLMGLQLAKNNSLMNDGDANNIINSLIKEILTFDEIFDETTNWCEEKTYGKHMNHLFVIGNGMNHATALEGQLKLMETVCIPTMSSDIEEFSHGMHRALKDDSYVIMINTDLDTDLMASTYDYLENKGIDVFIIDCKKINRKNSIQLEYNSYDQSILAITLIIQIISTYVPEIQNEDPNRNANDDYTSWVKTRV